MPFSNQEYLYNHLPSRFRREDKDLFLKRYLQFFGETLDDYDAKFDLFFESIDAATADEAFVEFWLENLFGWSWFPKWFTLADKRRLYGNFARHLARRGTRRGIELWLEDFHIKARAVTRPNYVGEWVWGEPDFFVADPLLILIEILRAERQAKTEMSAVSEMVWGEGFYVDVEPLFTTAEVNALLRYVQPHAQEILFVSKADGRLPPRLSNYTADNYSALRVLSSDGGQLEDFLNFVVTMVADLSAGNSLTGYTGNFTASRTLNRNTAQLEDAINFVRTIAADYAAKSNFANYSVAGFTPFIPQRNLNARTATLEEGMDFIVTIAADLKTAASIVGI